MAKAKQKKTVVKPGELNAIYEGITTQVVAECELTTDMVGGLPANDEQLEDFCRHYLKVPEDEVEDAVKRIKNEEIGERSGDQDPLDELAEKKSYGLNVVRKDEKGHWIGTWMVKAMMKVAASRLGLFVKKRGSKGDMAEMSRILAFGKSKKSGARDRIHLYSGNGKAVETDFIEYMGSVSNPKGRMSIKHHSETVRPGARFMFEWRFPPFKIKLNDVKMLFATISEIGLGSVKAMERGKLKVVSLEVTEHQEPAKSKK